MSTRCCIWIKGTEFKKRRKILLYHHYDGNPQHMLPLLKSYFKDYDSLDQDANRLIRDLGEEFEATSFMHTDIEYLYQVNPLKGTVEVL